MKKRILVNLFLSIFVIVGIVVAIQGKKMLATAKESANWPYVQGEVISSEMEVRKETDDDGTSVTYSAEVLFEYEVAGTVYSANRVSFGQYSSGAPGLARKILNKYPAGTVVKVYYNPDDPEISVLEPGTTFSTYLVLIGGLVFVFFGGLFLFVVNKHWSQAEPQEQAQEEPQEQPL